MYDFYVLRNGAEKSGLLCCAMAILDRLKGEQDVFIQPIIKQMRGVRPQIITNLVMLRISRIIIFVDCMSNVPCLQLFSYH